MQRAVSDAGQARAGSRFRPDIEGLRALSILAVALYHAHVPGFAGGFVGVDVFFVISGFLITRLLLQEATATGHIDLLRFWARRARRLLPNAVLVLLAVLTIGAVTVPQHLHKTLANDVVASVLYVANFRFAGQAVDYFRPVGAAPSLVLHFWSLCVEEQFYIVWPLLLGTVALIFPHRIARHALLLLALIWLASLAAALAMVRVNQPLAFFHTGARCWQLATGGLIAAGLPLLSGLSPRLRGLATWAGLAGILASVAALDDRLAYPGAWALLPTLSAAAVIVGGQGERVLGLPALQWLGARSYSWYLWHWPVLMLATALFPAHPRAAILSLPVSLAVAAAAYRHVENPIRHGHPLIAGQGRTFAAAGAAAALALIACWGLIGVSRLLAPEIYSRLAAATRDTGRNYRDKCHVGVRDVEQPHCAYGEPNARRRAVLFGDSHAAHWFEPLDSGAKAAGWALHAWTKTSCAAVDVNAWNSRRKAPYTECDQWREGIMRALTGPMRPDVVFISNFAKPSHVVDRETGELLSGDAADAAWREGFRAILKRLISAKVEVVVIRDIPRAAPDYGACLLRNGGDSCNLPRTEALYADAPDVAVVAELQGKVSLFDLTDRICDGTTCPPVKDGMIVYLDSHHITATFARSMAGEFQRELERRAGAAPTNLAEQ